MLHQCVATYVLHKFAIALKLKFYNQTFNSVYIYIYNHRMHPLPLGKGDLKMKNDFWALISIAEGGYLGIYTTVFKYTSQICVLFL